jgi:hypothetical protein
MLFRKQPLLNIQTGLTIYGIMMSVGNIQTLVVRTEISGIAHGLPQSGGSSSNYLRVLKNAPEIAKNLPALEKIPGAINWLVKEFASGASIRYLALAGAMIVAFEGNRPTGIATETQGVLRANLGNVNSALLERFLKMAEKKGITAEQLMALFKGAKKENLERIIRSVLNLNDKASSLSKEVKLKHVRALAEVLPSLTPLADGFKRSDNKKAQVNGQGAANNIVPLTREDTKGGAACIMTATSSYYMRGMTKEAETVFNLMGINPLDLGNTVLEVSVANSNPKGNVNITSIITRLDSSGRLRPLPQPPSQVNGIGSVQSRTDLAPFNGGSFSGSCDGLPATLVNGVPADTHQHLFSQPPPGINSVRAVPRR